MENIQQKSIISELFTDAELAELNFTQDEIDAIEEAELVSKLADVLPSTEEGAEALIQRIDKEFPTEDPQDVYDRFNKLVETDPVFINQIIAYGNLMDQVTEVPPPSTEKIDLSEVANLKKELKEQDLQEKLNSVLAQIKDIYGGQN